ncbi:hypothetical protein, partial [Aquipuribacter hungaricus]
MTGEHAVGAAASVDVPAPLDVHLTLAEASRTYAVPVAALRSRARAGGLRAYKVDGAHGREWRVSVRALEEAGFVVRPAGSSADERVSELEAQVAALRHELAGERRRADRADQQLGHALLEGGRLRSALERAQARAEDRTVPAGPAGRT